MNLEQSYFMIIKALEYSHNSNIFTLQESELVSKSLRILNNRKPQKQYYAVVAPDYVTLTYSCAIFTYILNNKIK